jgi:hypothetical protein
MTVTTQGDRGSGAGVLPDLNFETYPYERVQQMLDETVSLCLAAEPDPAYRCLATLTPGNENDWFGINGGYGIDFESSLHRFEAVPRFDADGRLVVSQPGGESVGRLHCRCLFAPANAGWQPGTQPNATIFDPFRSQRIVTADCELHFGDERITAYALGRTYPVVVDGKAVVLLGAVGNFMSGTGRFDGLDGTFVLAGRVNEWLGFAGSVSCRIVDPEGRIRTDREMPSITNVHDPFPDQTFLVMRGVKRDRTVRTTYGPPPGPDLVSLLTPSQMRTIITEPLVREGQGLRVNYTVGPVIAAMEADVSFNIAAPPGTAQTPVPFTTRELYTFGGDDSRSCGTVSARVTDGVAFGLRFPAAPRQAGVRFAGFGPVTGGTGQFEGVQGLLTVNSVIGIAPHTLSLVHVLDIVDPAGARRAGGGRTGRVTSAASSAEKLPATFEPLLQQTINATSKFVDWRRQIAEHAETIACFVSDWYERHLLVGEFRGLHIDGDNLTRILKSPVGPFDAETFNRYSGPARGVVCQYDVVTKRDIEEEKATVYRVWSPDNLSIDGWMVKRVTASTRQYFYPAHLPDLCDCLLDVSLNVYRDDVGVTAWIEHFEKRRHQRAAVAYTLPHEHEMLWFVKDISVEGTPVKNDVWMLSHEWRGTRDGGTAYYMVGVYADIDFETGAIEVSGNRFWRALFEETR